MALQVYNPGEWHETIPDDKPPQLTFFFVLFITMIAILIMMAIYAS